VDWEETVKKSWGELRVGPIWLCTNKDKLDIKLRHGARESPNTLTRWGKLRLSCQSET
jgi:hypothetical protein